MNKLDKIYEGKAKILFSTDDNSKLIQYFKDDVTAFNDPKFTQIKNGKGALNNAISSYFMKILKNHNIKTHFIRQIDDNSQLVDKITMISLEVIVRNIAAGTFCKKFGVKKGLKLARPLVEFSYKKDELGDPLIPEDHIIALNIASASEISHLKNQALLINKILQEEFAKIGIILVDFKIEFGKNVAGEVVLADEISPDSCRLRDKNTDESLDKDLFRENKGDIVKAYTEIAKRFGIIN